MNIELKSIPIRDLIDGYSNDPDSGVRAYGGKLDVRPPYQREFRYDEKQKQAVIETIMKGFPLNIMYWSEDGNGNFEMIDGQQRTLSICEFYTHDFIGYLPVRQKSSSCFFRAASDRNLVSVSMPPVSGEAHFSTFLSPFLTPR